jgi:hypothetical protein
MQTFELKTAKVMFEQNEALKKWLNRCPSTIILTN